MAAMMYTTGGKAEAGVAMVTEDWAGAEGVEDTVSDIATFLSRAPSSCKHTKISTLYKSKLILF